jgi:hypothetical protein
VIDAATNVTVVFFGVAFLSAMVGHAGGTEAYRFARSLTKQRSAVSCANEFDSEWS